LICYEESSCFLIETNDNHSRQEDSSKNVVCREKDVYYAERGGVFIRLNICAYRGETANAKDGKRGNDCEPRADDAKNA
jgi:hypothetical protein